MRYRRQVDRILLYRHLHHDLDKEEQGALMPCHIRISWDLHDLLKKRDARC
jgi:hypothetical protein